VRLYIISSRRVDAIRDLYRASHREWWFCRWTEEIHPGVMGCHEMRVRARICGFVFTVARWEV
jgi:hypothetical protein